MSAGFNQLFGLGGLGGNVVMIRYIRQSQTVKIPTSGRMNILLIAGHGSGAAVYAPMPLATGAGAGESATKLGVKVNADDAFVVTIGAGGAAVTAAASGTVSNGNDGGTSTVVGPGVDMGVYGGKGGRGAAAAGALAGGAGGSGGWGGDMHFPGGRGGNIAATSPVGVTTGGGAVNLFFPATQDATRGGDKIININRSTGGGGVGGRGGDLVTAAGASTGGGGYGGNAADNPTTTLLGLGGPNAFGVASDSGSLSPAQLVPALANWGLDIFGGGNGASGGTSPGGAGGAGGASGAGASLSMPGLFGGPGGAMSASGAGASGAGTCSPGQSAIWSGGSVTSGAGGGGMCVIIVFKE